MRINTDLVIKQRKKKSHLGRKLSDDPCQRVCVSMPTSWLHPLEKKIPEGKFSRFISNMVRLYGDRAIEKQIWQLEKEEIEDLIKLV